MRTEKCLADLRGTFGKRISRAASSQRGERIAMGDVADMMLDGTLCEKCGEFIGDAVDFPRACKSCAAWERDHGRDMRKTGLGGYQDHGPLPTAKVKCSTCGRKVKAAGLDDHMRDAHAAKRKEK
jgi:hypothetical protein